MADDSIMKLIDTACATVPLYQRRQVWDEAFLPRIKAGIPVSEAVDYANAAVDAWDRHRPKIPDVQP